jgi:hypothetical protein
VATSVKRHLVLYLLAVQVHLRVQVQSELPLLTLPSQARA